MDAWLRRLGALAIAVACIGSDSCFPASGGVDGGYVGLGTPSLEVTVDGTHVGPAAASAGSYADLVTNRAQAGGGDDQSLAVHVVTASSGFDLHVSRFGPSVPQLGAGAYRLETALAAATAEGTASPVGTPSVTAGALTLACAGSGCDGGVLAITVLDAVHLEGYLTAQMADPRDGQVSSVVASFYVPWRTYQP